MFDVRMLILRIASVSAIFYGASEFLKDPENLEQLLGGLGEIQDDVYDWGMNKFMGNPSNDTALQVKKTARQIYAEAFMEDETGFGTTNTQYANFADEEAVKAAYEKELADKAAAAEKEQMEVDAEEIENQEHDEEVVIEDLDDLIDNLTEEEIKKVEEKEEDPPKQEKVELEDPIIQDDL